MKTIVYSKKEEIKKKRFSLKIKYFIPFIIMGLLVVFLYFFVLKDIPKASVIGIASYPQSTKIYDRSGKLLYTVYASKNQTFVPLQKIPKNLRNASIAIEDKDFYNHGAVDFRGIARALVSTIFKKQVQGGSTITQQLVKNSLLTPERTITRKIKEIILSGVVESIYSKDRILEMYLNQVSYGGTAWGVQAASYVYFDKPAEKLTLAESAFLAGLPEAPSQYSPFGSNPEAGKSRQKDVLRKMREQGYITPSEEKEAHLAGLRFSKIQSKILAPHFVFYIKNLLEDKYGQRLVEQGGLSVITSLDLDIQNFTQQAVASEVAKLKKSNVTNGAAVVSNPKTGEILAMVGSKDYFDTEQDGNVNVTIAKRQPGSSIKPINYATGLIKGYTAATPFIDEPICFPNPGGKPYCPGNYDGKFRGIVQMRFALANSLNIPAVKMLKANGIESMIATASAMGIKSFDRPERYGLSLTLGGGEVTMLEMVQAFGVFADGGYKIDLQPILKVSDSKGQILEEYKPPKSPIFGKKVLPEGVAFIISHILQDNGARAMGFGTNSPLNIPGYPVSVKTGTTNDYRDNWTIGYTPSIVTAVWVGNNDNSQMNGIVSGITGAAPIWNSIMVNLLKGKPKELQLKPDSVYGKIICSNTGTLAPPEGTPDRCPTRFEYFIKGTENQKISITKGKVFVDKTTQQPAPAGKTENVEEKEGTFLIDPVGSKYCISCAPPQPEKK